MKKSQKSWSQLVAEIKYESQRVKKDIYKIVSDLKNVYGNKEYLDDCRINCIDPMTRLNKLFEYGTLTFFHLKDVLECFPDQESWKNKPIQDLYYESITIKRIKELQKRSPSVKMKYIGDKTIKPKNNFRKPIASTHPSTATLLNLAIKLILKNKIKSSGILAKYIEDNYEMKIY